MGARLSKALSRQGHGAPRRRGSGIASTTGKRKRKPSGRATQPLPHFPQTANGGSPELLLRRDGGQAEQETDRQANTAEQDDSRGNDNGHGREEEEEGVASPGVRYSEARVHEQEDSLPPNQVDTPPPPSLSLSDLAVSHEDFERGTGGYAKPNLIGSGTFGEVFRGSLLGADVAVKRSCSRFIQQNDFLEEVEFMRSLQHPNVVQLVAYCEEPGHWALAFELASKGSLRGLLNGSGRGSSSSMGHRQTRQTPPPFSWAQRIKVLEGAAKGLSYVHREVKVEGMQGMGTHRRVTSSNVLVFDDWVGKIGDCRLQSPDEDSLLPGGSRPLGHFCYEAPECLLYNQYTQKADVYAFGFVMLEAFCGCSATGSVDLGGGDGTRSRLGRRRLPHEGVKDWAQASFARRAYRQCLDARLESEIMSDKCLQCYCSLISRCLDNMPAKRPSMEKVASVLCSLQKC